MNDEDGAVEGALVPAPQPANIRYEDDDPGKVVRVLIQVERADGSVKEYEAREPHGFHMNDPESPSAQVFRRTGISVRHAGGSQGLVAGIPSVRLVFTANPRYNLHIRNGRSRRLGQSSRSGSSSPAGTGNDS